MVLDITREDYDTIVLSLVKYGSRESLALAQKLLLGLINDKPVDPEDAEEYTFNDSSFIQKIRWNNKRLSVLLKNGNVYHYGDVPLNVFDAFGKSESAGEFYNKHIKPVYSSPW